MHSFRVFFITPCEKIHDGFGHALAGHDRYMNVYERYDDEGLLEFYSQVENNLLLFEPKSDPKLKEHAEKIFNLEAQVANIWKEIQSRVQVNFGDDTKKLRDYGIQKLFLSGKVVLLNSKFDQNRSKSIIDQY